MKNKKELSERDIVTKYIIPSIEKAYQEMQVKKGISVTSAFSTM